MNISPVFRSLSSRYAKTKSSIRDLQQLGGELTRLSKTATFAMQRGTSSPDELLSAERILAKGNAIIAKHPGLQDVGPWQAGLEEYAEAVLFSAFINRDRASFRRVMTMEPETAIGALSDLVGELVRLAVREATSGKTDRVDVILENAEEIVGFLTSLDLTGPLRGKGDQARQHLRKLEDIRYDLSRRV